MNVSSCSLVVSLHGTVAGGELRDALGLAVSEMPGVEGVKNALRVR
jgi:osmotically-inducible protein OsmY